MYGGRFSPNDDQIELVGKALAKTGMRFATCAEDKLAEWFPETFYIQGCVCHEDIYKMGLGYEADMTVNPQKRNGCHCLSCKTELLNRPRAVTVKRYAETKEATKYLSETVDKLQEFSAENGIKL